MSLVGGGMALAGGLIGRKGRMNEQKNANSNFNQKLGALENFKFENNFGSVNNPAANMQNFGANLTNFGSELGNPGANLTNFASGMQNTASGAQNFASQMENTAEDLTVNTQQADMMAQQQQQGLSNTLGSLKGAAGGSGIAALAQSLAGAQNQNLQAASASIGQQESANQAQAASQGQAIQQAVAGESSMNQSREIDQASQNQIMAAQMGSANQQFGATMGNQNAMMAAQMGQSNQQFGATMGNQNQQFGASMDFEGQMARAQGAQSMQDRQYSQNTQLFDIAGQRKSAADAQVAAQRQSIFSGVGKLLGSDRKLKKNISLIGKSPSGINIYSFEYKDVIHGDGLYQGVMADEVSNKFVVRHQDGYDMVDYSGLDVEFKTIK